MKFRGTEALRQSQREVDWTGADLMPQREVSVYRHNGAEWNDIFSSSVDKMTHGKNRIVPPQRTSQVFHRNDAGNKVRLL